MIVHSLDIWHISYVDLTVRICLALALGGVIGLEREWSNHAAGFRTHILVCVGSAMIMLLSIYGFGDFAQEFNVRMDPARLAAQVITGVGFLGAGAIFRNGSVVTGLTTAASIWVVAAIGLCIGAGFYYLGVLATLLVLVSLFLLNKWEKQMLRDRRKHEICIRMADAPGAIGRIMGICDETGIGIAGMQVRTGESSETDGSDAGGGELTLVLMVKKATPARLAQAIESISRLRECLSVESGSLAGVSAAGSDSITERPG